jgi:hypothetical protein
MFMVSHLNGFGAFTASAGGGLTASLDFEAASSQYLSRTGDSGTNNKGTLSVWFLRESAGINCQVWGAANNGETNDTKLFFDTANKLRFERSGSISTNGGFMTTDTYASTAVWYHILLAFDAAQTGTDKVRIKINNVTPSAFDFDARSSFATFTFINTAVTHWIGRRSADVGYLTDGLMADYRWYDNQYLDASDFGQDNGGTWTRKLSPTVAAFGTNGWHLDGTGAVGTDVSGNGNDFTNTNTVTTSATVPPEI